MNSTHFLLLVLLELSCGSEGGLGLKLGPDEEDAACTTDGCYPETQGFTHPRNLKVDEETHEDLDSNVHSDGKGEFALVEKDDSNVHSDGKGEFALDEKDDSNVHSDGKGEFALVEKDDSNSYSDGKGEFALFEKDDSNVHSDGKGEFAFDEIGSMLSKVCSSVSGAFSTASGYFKRTVYNKTANMTNDFAETVREVFHEELYGFFEVMTKRFGDLLFSPDTCTSLGIVLQTFGQTALTISLVLLCLLLNYILLWFLSFLSIIAFDCTILLLHHFMGPEWIFSQTFWIGGYVLRLLKLMVLHPYISSALIIFLFLPRIIIPIERWTASRAFVHKIHHIELCVTDISGRFDVAVTDLKRRLQRVEENQKELLTLLKTMQQEQNHMV